MARQEYRFVFSESVVIFLRQLSVPLYHDEDVASEIDKLNPKKVTRISITTLNEKEVLYLPYH